MPRKPKAPEAPKDQRCCGTCRHWKRTGDVGEDATDGICRRYPPQVSMTEEGAACLQPFTDMSDLCGEHAPVLQ
jgi:hypothetical protein